MHGSTVGRHLVSRYFAIVTSLLLLTTPAIGQTSSKDEVTVLESLKPLDDLLQEQNKKWADECQAVAAKHGRESAEWYTANRVHSPIKIHGQRVLNFAVEHPDTPEALTCLSHIIDIGEGKPDGLFQMVCDELVRHHKDDPSLSWLCSRFTNVYRLKEMETFLVRLLKHSSNRTVQAAAAYNLVMLYDTTIEVQNNLTSLRRRFKAAGLLDAKPDFAKELDTIEQHSRDELLSQREKYMKLIMEKFADSKPWGVKNRSRTYHRLAYHFSEPDEKTLSFGEQIERLQYEIEHLRAGGTAPDFEGKDTDDETVKLSDYRGKPILIMFSFKGCGPCQELYPVIRKVQDKYSDDGLSVVGIMADETIETVKQAQDDGDITWRCIWDGQSGPIAQLFKVSGYPMITIIDSEGRIEARYLFNEEDIIAHLDKLLTK